MGIAPSLPSLQKNTLLTCKETGIGVMKMLPYEFKRLQGRRKGGTTYFSIFFLLEIIPDGPVV